MSVMDDDRSSGNATAADRYGTPPPALTGSDSVSIVAAIREIGAKSASFPKRMLPLSGARMPAIR